MAWLTGPSHALDIRISDTRESNFYLDALRTVLDKTGIDYTLIYTAHPVSSQKRKIQQVRRKEIDLIYAGTSPELENTLRPIRFPVTRGLVGQRLFIINQRFQKDYEAVWSLDDLMAFVCIQGIGWGDNQVLTNYNLRLIEKLYDDIFDILNRGNPHYFPRSVIEVFAELKDKQAEFPNLAVEQKLVLTYPSALFFFVHPDNNTLAHALEEGFRLSYEDGTYPDFFYNHPLIRSSLEQAKLDSRTHLAISNPFVSEATRAILPRYWHQ